MCLARIHCIRGADEIASCVLEICKELFIGKKYAVIWSDSCANQNKNFIMLMMLQYLQHIITTLQSIEHKFFVPGNNFMASDIDFSVIEKLKHRSD